MKKEFTKNNLRTGHIVKLRNEETTILIGDDLKDCKFIYYFSLSYYNNELFYENDYELRTADIMEVYELKDKLYFENTLSIIYDNNNFLNDLIEKDYVELIWKRENSKRKIDWTKVPKWTRVLVKNHNSKWKRAYFLGIDDDEYYRATFHDKFTNIDTEKYYFWEEIKIFDENDIKEEWYK